MEGKKGGRGAWAPRPPFTPPIFPGVIVESVEKVREQGIWEPVEGSWADIYKIILYRRFLT